MIKLVRILNSEDELVNEIPFEKGFNIIIADCSKDLSIEDNSKKSRNGAGKSSTIEIIDFCLGNDRSRFLKVEALTDWCFSIDIELDNNLYRIERHLNDKDKDKIYIEEADFSNWIIKPKQVKDKSNYFIKLKDWRIVLGKFFFNINKEEDNDESFKYYPSFRSLIGYFFRNGKAAYLSPFTTFEKQNECQTQVNNTFLLNLNWEYALKFQKLKDDKKILDQLKAANKAGLLEGYEGKIGKLEAEKISLDRRINEFTSQIASYNVHPQYEAIQQQSNAYTQQIHTLNNNVIIKKGLLSKYKQSQEDESDISLKLITQR